MDEKWMWHKKLGQAHMILIFENFQKSLSKVYLRSVVIMTQPVSSIKEVNKPRVLFIARM